MCAGPVKNLYEDAVGITKAKDDAQAAQKKYEADLAAAEAAAKDEAIRVAAIEEKKKELIAKASADETTIGETLGGELDTINTTNANLTADLITNMQAGTGPSGPSASELAANSAAMTSQNVLNKEKKKKKKGALKIPYSPSSAKPNQRGPKSTKADLQIEGQTQSTGTGTNLAI
tara:strand:+ start:866 stop:1390 length:525 start_codon:yes stop_codon:yes gene_type:complete